MRMCATSAQRGAQGGRDLRGRWRLRPTCALLERVLGSRRRHRPALGTLLAGGALLAITGVLGGVDVHPATALAAAPVVLPLVAAAQEPEPDDEESAPAIVPATIPGGSADVAVWEWPPLVQQPTASPSPVRPG